MITPTLILPHQGGGKFFRELDAPQLCCGVLHLGFVICYLEFLADVWSSNRIRGRALAKGHPYHEEKILGSFVLTDLDRFG